EAPRQLPEGAFGDAQGLVGIKDFGELGGHGADAFNAQLAVRTEGKPYGAGALIGPLEANLTARAGELGAFNEWGEKLDVPAGHETLQRSANELLERDVEYIRKAFVGVEDSAVVGEGSSTFVDFFD